MLLKFAKPVVKPRVSFKTQIKGNDTGWARNVHFQFTIPMQPFQIN